jgi:hypothetical protein
MYNPDKNEIERTYPALYAFGWKQWGTNELTVKLMIDGGKGHAGEVNLNAEEVENVITILRTALAQANDKPDNEVFEDPWGESPF